MKINFCTLYNSDYSAKGLAMYYSLVEHCSDFHLYIFAFDDMLVEALRKMNLEHVTVVTLKEFEDEELLRIKPTRTKGEYCWTCSSSIILYCLEHYGLDNCTYIDADLYFYSNPSVLLEEMGDNDVQITEHRYTKKYDQSKDCGKYCVQFVTFKNTPNGLKILKWWRNACIDWCYNRKEDGKFGDQKYLDDWTERFEGVHVLQHLGGGVAPWNMQQYTFEEKFGGIVGRENATCKEFQLVFFHFHDILSRKIGNLRELTTPSKYYMTRSAIHCIYDGYVAVLKQCYYKMKEMNHGIDGLATKPYTSYWNMFRKTWKRMVKYRNFDSYYWREHEVLSE